MPRRSGRPRPAPKADSARGGRAQSARPGGEHALRIIGGRFRGRTLHAPGDPRTRPMKDRVREAVFNLVGPSIRGTHAIDLFAGSGALGLEAISRGAERATLIERHFPTAELIRRNVRSLGLEQQASVLAANAFLWVRHELPARALDRTTPWTVFCSPPYDFYVDRRDEMLQLIELLREGAPAGSLLVVESDLRFSVQQLACAQGWDERTYRQARVAVLQIASSQ